MTTWRRTTIKWKDSSVFTGPPRGWRIRRIPRRAVCCLPPRPSSATTWCSSEPGASETVRILLNSKSGRFPEGLANSSGKVGRYLMDTVGSSLRGQVPLLESLPPQNEDGASGHAFYAPWWGYQDQQKGRLGFARGYHIEFGGGRHMPDSGTLRGLERLTHGSYGRKLKEDARRYYGSFVGFAGRGRVIPNAKAYCAMHPRVNDHGGTPRRRF